MIIRSFEDWLRRKGLTSPDYIILYTSKGSWDSREFRYEDMPRDDIQVIAVYHTDMDVAPEMTRTLWAGDDYFYLPGDTESRAGRLLPWPQFEAILKEATHEST